MKIQSLSVVVPNSNCINNCAFCVSKMHCDAYKDQMNDNLPFFDLYLKDYLKRLEVCPPQWLQHCHADSGNS